MKLAAALLAAGMSLVAAAAENVADYAYQAEIEPEGTATWYRAEIPFSVQWQAVYADLRDLRVFDAKGAALPFALTKRDVRRVVKERREASARLFPLYAEEASPGSAPPGADLMRDSGLRVRREASGAVEIEVMPAPPRARDAASSPLPSPPRKVLRGWLLDASAADFALERLILDWSGEREGFFRFAIAGSDDLEHWRDWGQGQIAQLNFDGQSIAQREIPLPRRKARYLRLLWQDVTHAAGLRGARLSGAATDVVVESAPLTWSQALAGEAVPGREGEFVWHFPVSLPLERVSIVMDEANTLAPVVISGRDFQPPAPAAERPKGRPLAAEILRGERRVRDVFRGRSRERAKDIAWRPLASGVVYRLSASMGEQMETELDLPGVPVNQLRLRVDPRGGGLGAQTPLIRVALTPRELTFLARGAAPYRLGVGRAEAQAADLPLSTLIPSGIGQATASGRLGHAVIAAAPLPQAEPPAASAPKAREAGAESGGLGERKIVLWGILLVGVLLLAGMIGSLLLKKDNPRKG
jgi:hypothetical protein